MLDEQTRAHAPDVHAVEAFDGRVADRFFRRADEEVAERRIPELAELRDARTDDVDVAHRYSPSWYLPRYFAYAA